MENHSCQPMLMFIILWTVKDSSNNNYDLLLEGVEGFLLGIQFGLQVQTVSHLSKKQAH